MKFTNLQKILIIATLPVVGLTISLKLYLKEEKIRGALMFGHLSKLPENIKNVKIETVGNPFSRRFWLVFESTPTEIDKWVDQSESLTLRESPHLNQNYIAKSEGSVEIEVNTSNDLAEPNRPGWFVPLKETEAALYEASIPNEALYCKVWVDRKRGIVYVLMSRS